MSSARWYTLPAWQHWHLVVEPSPPEYVKAVCHTIIPTVPLRRCARVAPARRDQCRACAEKTAMRKWWED